MYPVKLCMYPVKLYMYPAQLYMYPAKLCMYPVKLFHIILNSHAGASALSDIKQFDERNPQGSSGTK